MAKMEQFEDMKAWQEARNLTQKIYALTDREELARDYALRDPMRRACVSMMSHIASGFERKGNWERRQSLGRAQGAAAEVRSHLYAAQDVDRVDADAVAPLQEQTLTIMRMLGGFMKHLQKDDDQGARSEAVAAAAS